MSKRRGSVDIAAFWHFLLLSVKWQICGKSHIYIELRCWYETVMHSGAYSPSISTCIKVTLWVQTHTIWIWITRACDVCVVLCANCPVLCDLNCAIWIYAIPVQSVECNNRGLFFGTLLNQIVCSYIIFITVKCMIWPPYTILSYDLG